MYAITIQQPWASLIALGIKTTEYRSWSTRHRGPIAIHAAASRPHDYDELFLSDRARRRLGPPGDLPRGCIVAVATLADVAWSEEDGCYGWQLRNIKPVVPPLAARGKQRLWPLDEATAATLVGRTRR